MRATGKVNILRKIFFCGKQICLNKIGMGVKINRKFMFANVNRQWYSIYNNVAINGEKKEHGIKVSIAC